MKCPLAAGILSGTKRIQLPLLIPLGLYRLPAAAGDNVCVIDGVADTLYHLADIVGPSGNVCAWRSRPSGPPIRFGGLANWYDNIRVIDSAIESIFYDPAHRRTTAMQLLRATYRPGLFGLVRSCREVVLKTILSFMGGCQPTDTFHTLLVFYPSDLPAVDEHTIGDYEQHLIRTLQPVCRLAHSTNTSAYWLSLVVKLGELSDTEHESDIICDRVFDILADFARPYGTIRPKEQLRIDPKFMPATVMLTARYRKT